MNAASFIFDEEINKITLLEEQVMQATSQTKIETTTISVKRGTDGSFAPPSRQAVEAAMPEKHIPPKLSNSPINRQSVLLTAIEGAQKHPASLEDIGL